MTTTTNALSEHFAEVIFSTNEMLIAQCYKEELSSKPLKSSVFQGSTVKIVSSYDSSYVAFGLIAKINNSSLDSVHKPSALGLTSKELEHLQPQVFELNEDTSSLINLIKRNQLKPDLLSNVINLGYKLRKSNYDYLVKTGQG